jgi:hypothetical protein
MGPSGVAVRSLSLVEQSSGAVWPHNEHCIQRFPRDAWFKPPLHRVVHEARNPQRSLKACISGESYLVFAQKSASLLPPSAAFSPGGTVSPMRVVGAANITPEDHDT